MKRIDLSQGSKEWHQYRRTRLGASEVPSILGVDGAYKSFNAVLRDKVNQTVEDNSFKNKLFQDGHEYEKLIRDEINEKRGFRFRPEVIEHDSNSRFFASLDGLDTKAEMILEVKSTTKQEIIDRISKADIPPHYYFQMQWQFYVTGLDRGLLAVIKDGHMVTIDVNRSQRIIDEIIPHAHRFIEALDAEMVKEFTYLDNPKYLQLVQLKRASSEMSAQLEQVDAKIKELSTELLGEYKATCLEGQGIRVEVVERVGAVDYSKIEALKGMDLEPYRKKGSRYTQVKLIGEK